MADQTTGPDQTGARAHRPAGNRTGSSDQTSQTGPRPTPRVPAAADRTGTADQTTEVTR